jgi:hypothetical protein
VPKTIPKPPTRLVFERQLLKGNCIVIVVEAPSNIIVFEGNVSCTVFKGNALTCKKHGPAHDGYEEVAGLADELEGSLEMKQRVDVLQRATKEEEEQEQQMSSQLLHAMGLTMQSVLLPCNMRAQSLGRTEYHAVNMVIKM